MLKKIFIILTSLMMTSIAWGVQVTIDPVDYLGGWNLPGQPMQSGAQTLDLQPGLNAIQIGAIGSIGFTVDASGLVSSNNPASATGGQNLLTLKNQTINIDPNQFSGQWVILGVTSSSNSSASVTLVPSMAYRFAMGGIGIVDTNLNSSSILSANNSTSFASTPGNVQFNILNTEIDPVAFVGSYFIPGVTSAALSGPNNLNLVIGAAYQINIGTSFFRFLIDDASSISILNNSMAATTLVNKITLNNSTIDVMTNGFAGDWAVSLGTGPLNMDQTIVLITDIDFTLFVAGGNLANFKINDNGQVQVLSGNQATGGIGSLSFNTVKLVIDPFSYTGQIGITGIDNTFSVYLQAGPGEVVLVGDLTYAVFVNGIAHNVSIGIDCSLAPEVINVTADSGVNLSCMPIMDEPLTLSEQCQEIAAGSWFSYLKCISRELKKQFRDHTLSQLEVKSMYKELFMESIDIYNIHIHRFKKAKVYTYFYWKIFWKKRRVFKRHFHHN